ncbi:unnamed protein product [marine sediment metagenome]|uniref:Uncharacterized protein n=1 Tax=marine sediment metagenome TaxID=412755 RepID=X0RWX4_9ZZZZ
MYHSKRAGSQAELAADAERVVEEYRSLLRFDQRFHRADPDTGSVITVPALPRTYRAVHFDYAYPVSGGRGLLDGLGELLAAGMFHRAGQFTAMAAQASFYVDA